MHHSDFHFDTPAGGELLAEIGIGRDTVIEVIEEDRAMRCPDRDAAPPDRANPFHRRFPGAAGAMRVEGKPEKGERKGAGERDRPGSGRSRTHRYNRTYQGD